MKYYFSLIVRVTCLTLYFCFVERTIWRKINNTETTHDVQPSHWVKCVQIRSFFWFVFSRIRTEYGPEKTPYLDSFHAVSNQNTLVFDVRIVFIR